MAGSALRRERMAAGLGSIWWQYLLLFLTVAASWAGVPLIGTTALGAAAVAASQRRLDLAAVIVVSVIAGEAGGLGGYAIGRRWGRRLLERPGRHQTRRERMIERGERLYAQWGWLAVFVTPAIVSGTAKMPPYRFALWNLLDALGWTVSVAASAYGSAGSPPAITPGTTSPSWSSGSPPGYSSPSPPCGVTAGARPSVLLPSQTGRTTIPRDQVD
jgi:membrane protein DedA with SNARE-associated domain